MDDNDIDLYIQAQDNSASDELMNFILDKRLPPSITWFHSLTNQYYECLLPLISQMIANHYLIFYPCILFRLVIICNPFYRYSDYFNHAIAGLTGILVLWHLFANQIAILLMATWIGYMIIRCLSQKRGIVMALVSLSYILLW